MNQVYKIIYSDTYNTIILSYIRSGKLNITKVL